MVRHLLTLGKQTLIYGASSAAIQIVGVLTVPIFARVFAPEDYGIAELALVTFSLLLIVVDLGLVAGSQRSYFDHEDRSRQRTILSTAFAASLGVALLACAALILAQRPIADFLFQDPDHEDVVVLLALLLPSGVLANFAREIMRLKFRAWHYSASSILSALVAGGVGVVLVLWFDVGIEGIVLGVLLGHAIAGLYGIAVVRSELKLAFSRLELRTMLSFGVPLIPTAFAMWALAFTDRLMLGQVGTLAEVGEFSVASRIALALMLGVTALATAFSPFILSLYAQDRDLERQIRGRTLTYVAVALTTAGLALGLLARELTAVIAPDYDSAYRAVGLLVLGVIFFGLSQIAATGLSLSRQTKWFAIYSAVALVLNVGLNIALIPPLGEAGAATATAAAYGLLTFLQYRKAQQLAPAPFEPAKVVTAVALAAALMVVGLARIEPLALALGVKAATLVAFVVALRLLHVVDANDVAQMRALLRRIGLPARPAVESAGP